VAWLAPNPPANSSDSDWSSSSDSSDDSSDEDYPEDNGTGYHWEVESYSEFYNDDEAFYVWEDNESASTSYFCQNTTNCDILDAIPIGIENKVDDLLFSI